MSSHIGVSCDVCLKSNFSERRYKCLICDNYDLCGSCYDILAESQAHSSHHPMQCILTKTAYDLFYAGENLAHRSIVSLTCPHCNRAGFLPRTLLLHCIEEHSSLTSAESQPTKQLVMCPICVLLPSQEYTNRFVSLTDHLARDHEGETSIPWSNANLQRRTLENKRELVDDDDDDDDDDGEEVDDDEIDCVPFNILVERVFLKEQARRQEPSNPTILHHHQQQQHHQRRTLSRQTTLRASRHTLRGHYHPSTSYSTVAYAGLNGSRVPYDPPVASETYYDMLYAQNPIEFHSPTFLDDPHHFPPPLSSYVPSLKQYDQDHTNPTKKSTIINIRQKRPCQQPIQSSFASLSLSDDQRWQEQSTLFPSTNDDATKSTGRLENDSRSLIGKCFKEIDAMPTDHSKDTHRHLFAKSILLSSIGLRQNYL